MSRRAVLCALALFSATAADAGDATRPENVIVNGQSVLSGVWKITRPASGSIGTFQDAKFGPMEPGFCRVAQSENDLETHCVGPSFLWDGTGSVDGQKLHLAWGTMMLRMVVDATLRSPTAFDGTFAIKLSGIVYTDPDTANGTKVDLAKAAPDTSPQAVLLTKALAEIENAALVEPHDAAALAHNAAAENNVPPTKDDLEGLGRPEMTFYLGHTDRWNAGKRLENFFSVYDIEFANGERVCEIHQTDTGVLDGLICA
jgi:hypothetical protein